MSSEHHFESPNRHNAVGPLVAEVRTHSVSSSFIDTEFTQYNSLTVRPLTLSEKGYVSYALTLW